mgnify:CR=1 FL=1
MTTQEIKNAVDAGLTVRWSNGAYTVIKDTKGEYFIKCSTGNSIGLTWMDGTTLNGKEADFFIEYPAGWIGYDPTPELFETYSIEGDNAFKVLLRNGYWILLHNDGKFSTVACNTSAYGSFQECLKLLNDMVIGYTVKCNNCGWEGNDEDLSLVEFDTNDNAETPTAIDNGIACDRISAKPENRDFLKGCPNCKTDAYLMDIE